jgi:uncharacterized protein (DUF1697 family)
VTEYVALLRGINLGGYAKVPMAPLRELFDQLGMPGARTYIQSGNVVFDAADDEASLVARLEAAVAQRFAVNAAVMVRTRRQWGELVAANPFAGRDIDPAKLGVSFLSKPVAAGVDFTVPDGIPEEVVAVGRQLYVHYPLGMGVSTLPASFLAKRLAGASATTRNWRTVEKIWSMLQQ